MKAWSVTPSAATLAEGVPGDADQSDAPIPAPAKAKKKSPTRPAAVSPPPAVSSPPGSAKKKSKAARNVEAIAAKREERRAAAAAEKVRVDTELAEHSGDKNDLEYRRAVRGFRSAASRGEVQIPGYMGSTTSRIQVFVRMRPLFGREDFDVLTRLGRHALVAHRAHTDTQYVFDGIFGGEDSSELVTKNAVQNQLDEVLQEVVDRPVDDAPLARKKSGGAKKGSPTKPVRQSAADRSMPRLTVFAYGQTGSGKTYTMETVSESVISSLLQFSAEAPELMGPGVAGGGGSDEAGVVFVAMTMFEIFGDKCYDLLAPADGTGVPPLVKSYEDANSEFRLPNLTEILLVDESTAATMLRRGQSHRRSGANAVHDNSSRSHMIIRLEVRDVVGGAPLCRLTLVDLAGSERASETMSDDAATRQEGAEINKSLLAVSKHAVATTACFQVRFPNRDLLAVAAEGVYPGAGLGGVAHAVQGVQADAGAA